MLLWIQIYIGKHFYEQAKLQIILITGVHIPTLWRTMQIKTDGLIIGLKKINENDRYLTILTRDSGIIYAYANGANRIKHKLCSSTSLLCYCDFVLFENKGRYTVNSADLNNAFFNISHNLEKLSLANYFFDIATTLCTPDIESGAFLRLLLNTLYFLEKDTHEMLFLKTIYEMRTCLLSGLAPDLLACKECAVYEDSQMFFSLENGNIICSNCFKNELQKSHFFKLDADMLYVLRYIIFSKLEDLFKIKLSCEKSKALTQITEQYLIKQTDRKFNSLDYFYSMLL